jgi:hypothetical protein
MFSRISIESAADALRVFDPEPCATLEDIHDGALTRSETAVYRHPCGLVRPAAGRMETI